MQTWSWLLAAALLACSASARPDGRPEDAVEALAQPQQAPAPALSPAPAPAPADLPRVEVVTAQPELQPDAKPAEVIPDEPKIENEEKPSPVPIEPGVQNPDDSNVYPEGGSLRSPGPRGQQEEAPGTRTARTYLPAEARGAEAEADLETPRPRRGPGRQLTDIHVLFLSHPEHAARLSSGGARPGPGHGALLGEGRVRDGPGRRTRRTARRLVEKEYPLDEGDTEEHPRRVSLLEQDVDNDIIPRAPDSGPGDQGHGPWVHQPHQGHQPGYKDRDVSPTFVSVTTFIPTLTAVTTTSAGTGAGAGPARVTWPLANYFPIVIQDPLLGLYSTWLSGAGLSGLAANLVEYGPEADVCGGGGRQRARRARAAGREAEREGPGEQEDTTTEADESVTENSTLQAEDEGAQDASRDFLGPGPEVITETGDVETVTEEAGRDRGAVEDSVAVENGEHGLPAEEDAYREEEDGVEDDPPQVTVEKKLRKTKNKLDKRINKVVAQVGGLTKRVESRVQQVLAESGVLDGPADRLGSGLRDEPAAAEGGAGAGAGVAAAAVGPTLTRIVLRRGGVAVAGPGGIATAAFGGTAIVGPGGIAYTAPDSTAVAGPGARVVAVPSERLLDMYKAFRQANERGLAAYRPEWLGTIPDDSRLVAVGPAIYRNPPEEEDKAARPAHWVFGNTRVLGLRR